MPIQFVTLEHKTTNMEKVMSELAERMQEARHELRRTQESFDDLAAEMIQPKYEKDKNEPFYAALYRKNGTKRRKR